MAEEALMARLGITYDGADAERGLDKLNKQLADVKTEGEKLGSTFKDIKFDVTPELKDIVMPKAEDMRYGIYPEVAKPKIPELKDIVSQQKFEILEPPETKTFFSRVGEGFKGIDDQVKSSGKNLTSVFSAGISNVGGFVNNLVQGTVKSKEFAVLWKEIGGIFGTVTKMLGLSGLGVGAFLTGSLAMSSRVKQFWMELKPIMMTLGEYMGGQLDPLFTSITQLAGNFVNKFIELDQKYGVLQKISDLGVGVVSFLNEVVASTGFANLVKGGANFLQQLKDITTSDAWTNMMAIYGKTAETFVNILFGKDDSTGVLKTLLDLGVGAATVLSKVIDISTKIIGPDATGLALMAGALVLTGHPHLAAILVGGYMVGGFSDRMKGIAETSMELREKMQTPEGRAEYEKLNLFAKALVNLNEMVGSSGPLNQILASRSSTYQWQETEKELKTSGWKAPEIEVYKEKWMEMQETKYATRNEQNYIPAFPQNSQFTIPDATFILKSISLPKQVVDVRVKVTDNRNNPLNSVTTQLNKNS